MATKQVNLYVGMDDNIVGQLVLPLTTSMFTFAESIRQFVRNNRLTTDHTFILSLSQSNNTQPEAYIPQTAMYNQRIVIPDMGLGRWNAIGSPYKLRILVPNDIFIEEYAGLTLNDLIQNITNGRGENMRGWRFDPAAPLSVRIMQTPQVGLAESFNF